MRKSKFGQGDILYGQPPGARTSCPIVLIIQGTVQRFLYVNEGGGLGDLAKNPPVGE